MLVVMRLFSSFPALVGVTVLISPPRTVVLTFLAPLKVRKARVFVFSVYLPISSFASLRLGKNSRTLPWFLLELSLA